MIPKSNRERAAEAVPQIENHDQHGMVRYYADVFGVRLRDADPAHIADIRRGLERFLDDLDRERTPRRYDCVFCGRRERTPPVCQYECGFCGETNEVQD